MKTNGSSSLDDGQQFAPAPSVAIVTNSFTPYRIHLHRRIVDEVPEIELWSLATHSNGYQRWSESNVPASIRPVEFGRGEPTNEQTQLRYSVREWKKGGRIIRWLEAHRPAAVFCQGCGDVGRLRILRWCYCNKVPCFLTGDCNIRGDQCRGLKRLIKSAVFRSAVAWSHGTMPCGRYGREMFNRYGAASKPSFFFPFTPDVELFENPPATAVAEACRRFALERPRRILFSARLMRVKRPDLAIAAFAAIAHERPEWELIMAGDGVLRRELEGRVPTDLRDRVLWTGFVEQTHELAGLYANCDVLLIPSDKEPWGVVLAEAAAAGLAIVASDVVGASPELVHSERNGMLFASGKRDDLIRALQYVTDSDNIDRLKSQSRQVLREWLAEADPVEGFRAALAECGLNVGGTPRAPGDGRGQCEPVKATPFAAGSGTCHPNAAASTLAHIAP